MSARSRFPTAGDFAGDIEPEPDAALAEAPLTESGDACERNAGSPSYDDPAVLPVARVAATAVVAEPSRDRTPQESGPAGAPGGLKGPKSPKKPRPPRTRSDVANHRWGIAAGAVVALGMSLSVILAIGALFVALGAAQGSAFFSHLSDLCDALVGPLTDVFNFTGANADKKEAAVGWGLGSVGYLLLGRFLQSVLLSRFKD
ncbi:hypothetical protein [Aeromicrobium sp.]